MQTHSPWRKRSLGWGVCMGESITPFVEHDELPRGGVGRSRTRAHIGHSHP
jgi:hypothetical protein